MAKSNIAQAFNDEMDDLLKMREENRERNHQMNAHKKEMKRKFNIPISAIMEAVKTEEMDDAARAEFEDNRGYVRTLRGLPLFPVMTKTDARKKLEELAEKAAKEESEKEID